MARKTDYESIAAGYDRRYQDNQYPGTSATLRAFVSAGQRVLEVGCGTGHWLEQLEAWGCRVSGVDPAAAMIEKAAARGLRAELVRGAAEALPWPDATFDRVVCINALHHFTDKPRFAHEARRVLRSADACCRSRSIRARGRTRGSSTTTSRPRSRSTARAIRRPPRCAVGSRARALSSVRERRGRTPAGRPARARDARARQDHAGGHLAARDPDRRRAASRHRAHLARRAQRRGPR